LYIFIQISGRLRIGNEKAARVEAEKRVEKAVQAKKELEKRCWKASFSP